MGQPCRVPEPPPLASLKLEEWWLFSQAVFCRGTSSPQLRSIGEDRDVDWPVTQTLPTVWPLKNDQFICHWLEFLSFTVTCECDPSVLTLLHQEWRSIRLLFERQPWSWIWRCCLMSKIIHVVSMWWRSILELGKHHLYPSTYLYPSLLDTSLSFRVSWYPSHKTTFSTATFSSQSYMYTGCYRPF